MKFSVVLAVCLVAVCLFGTTVRASEREVRSYVNELEYVDHVDVTPAAAEEAAPEADHAMMETESGADADADEHHYSMESESEAAADEEFGASAFIEASESNDVDTEVMRAMALEIHDNAVSLLAEEVDEDAMMVEMEADAEAETEIDEYAGLSAAEIAQAKADEAAEKADAAADAKDNSEEKKDKTEAKTDVIQTATATGEKPTPTPEQRTTEAGKVVVELPADLSAEHAQTLRINEAATKTIQGALGEMGSILVSKDDTIRSLVANISYLTVNIGKLANQVDLQRTYIAALNQKLAVANARNAELNQHAQHSADTVVSVRGQLKHLEERLNAQDHTTKLLNDFLTKNTDNTTLPTLVDNVEIRGARKASSRVARRLARRARRQARVASNMRPVDGTQTWASSQYAQIGQFGSEQQPQQVQAGPSYYNAPTPLSHPTFEPAYAGGNIPTVIVEVADSGY